jgi:23S rRNA (cytidine2498-2'-O)-methyltransferase
MSEERLFSGPATGYLAPADYIDHVKREIGQPDLALGRLLFKSGPAVDSVWTQNTWLSPVLIEFASIGEAARKLKDIQRNWALHPTSFHRRAQLIVDSLPHVSARPKPFPLALPASPMGGFALLDEHRLVASPGCSSPFPHGEIAFAENKIDPPSRAYLKLYEALTLSGRLPGEGDRCIDAGACPGGWTWVLTGLGARVTAIDRSELDPRLMKSPLVEFMRHSAFTLRPEELGRADWLCSDVICYPDKLYEWVRAWIDSGLCRNFICTVKMQGEPDWKSIGLFKSIPGSRLVHLSNNKHELTWIKVGGGAEGA